MDNKFFVGQRVSNLETYSPVGPITGIALVVDENNEYRAGTDDGYVMEIQCPYGTQAMADDLLNRLRGKTYRGYSADAAELAPEAELGDGITVGGVYSMLAYRSVGFGPGHMSGISAPGENELEHEYPYVSQAEKQIERKIASTRSMITKTAEEIRLEVQNEMEGLSSSLTVELGKITQRVTDAEGSIEVAVSTLDGLTVTDSGGTVKIKGGMVTSDGLQVNAANIQGLLTASQINAAGLMVDAANITGTLTIGQLPGSVATESDIPTHMSDLIDDSDFVTERGVTTIINGTVTTDYVNALGVYAQKLMGRTVGLLDSSQRVVGSMDITYTTTGFGLGISTTYGGIQLTSGGNIYLKSDGGPFLQLGQDGLCQLGGGPLVVGTDSYGPTLPSSGTYGQVYFLLE